MAASAGSVAGAGESTALWLLTRHRLLFALALLLFASTASTVLRGSARHRGSSGSGVGVGARSTRPRALGGGEASSCSDNGRPSMVWVMLGDPSFQPYLLESVQQARVFNADECFFVVVDPHYFAWDHAWVPQLRSLKVLLVNYTVLTAPFVHDFSRAYERLWDELGRALGSMMQPTINGKSNMDFTMVTMVRLVAVHQLMHYLGVERVVHVENDQMTYGPITAVQRGAEACGVTLAMSKVGVRLAPATVWARDSRALKAMLDFILDAISGGMDRAIEIAGDRWVTDMSLPAAYFDMQRAANSTAVVKFPNSADGSCLMRETGFIFDGLGLGQWCCGSFEWPRQRLSVRLEESDVDYSSKPFEWRVVNNLRVPFWNDTAVYNLHTHSKQLHLFRSTDLDVAPETLDLVPLHN